MHPLAERVLGHIRRQELLRAGDRVGVAVSGGIDSVALLRLLLELWGELGIVVSVVHFNHKLRGAESDADQEFAAGLAREHDLEFYVDSDDVARVAAEERVSLETAARDVRYGFFRYLLGSGGDGAGPSAGEGQSFAGLSSDGSKDRGSESQGKLTSPLLAHNPRQKWGTRANLNAIVTGHTLDDQAETVLMRLIRGSGLRGLGGIFPRIPVEDDKGNLCGEIVRPLLGIRRRELESYLKEIGQGWREDTTNADLSFTRNRVRKLVLPLLEKEFNPAAAENFAELAEIARGEEDYWDNEVAGWMGTVVHWSEPDWVKSLAQPRLVQIGRQDYSLPSRIEAAPWLVMNASVDRLWFLGESLAVQRRLIKAIGDQAGIPLEFKHVEGILRFAAKDGAGKEFSLPLGWKLQREPEELLFVTPDLRGSVVYPDYEYPIPVPGAVAVPEAGSRFEAELVPAEAQAGYNPDHLLDADSLPRSFKVRNWRPGDRFWPAHTKSPKKIKELLQERHVPHSQRHLWPVVHSGNEIIWMRGFPVPEQYRANRGHEGLMIQEKPLVNPGEE